MRHHVRSWGAEHSFTLIMEKLGERDRPWELWGKRHVKKKISPIAWVGTLSAPAVDSCPGPSARPCLLRGGGWYRASAECLSRYGARGKPCGWKWMWDSGGCRGCGGVDHLEVIRCLASSPPETRS